MPRQKEFYYDVTRDSDVVIAGAHLEEGLTPDIRKRINHAERYPEKRVDFDKWDWNGHSEAEKKATINSFELAKDGYNLIIWISPKSHIYPEARINFQLVGKDEKGELFLDGWGMPLLYDQKKSVELGDRLVSKYKGATMDGFNNAEELRIQPIGFKIKDQMQWLSECRKMIPELEDIWDYIGTGEAEKRKEELVKVVVEGRKYAKGDNVKFELFMIAQGHRLNPFGDHGASRIGFGNGLFNISKFRIFQGGEVKVEKVDGRLVCPCGEVLKEGVTRCPKCGLRFVDSV